MVLNNYNRAIHLMAGFSQAGIKLIISMREPTNSEVVNFMQKQAKWNTISVRNMDFKAFTF